MHLPLESLQLKLKIGLKIGAYFYVLQYIYSLQSWNIQNLLRSTQKELCPVYNKSIYTHILVALRLMTGGLRWGKQNRELS